MFSFVKSRCAPSLRHTFGLLWCHLVRALSRFPLPFSVGLTGALEVLRFVAAPLGIFQAAFCLLPGVTPWPPDHILRIIGIFSDFSRLFDVQDAVGVLGVPRAPGQNAAGRSDWC